MNEWEDEFGGRIGHNWCDGLGRGGGFGFGFGFGLDVLRCHKFSLRAVVRRQGCRRSEAATKPVAVPPGYIYTLILGKMGERSVGGFLSDIGEQVGTCGGREWQRFL